MLKGAALVVSNILLSAGITHAAVRIMFSLSPIVPVMFICAVIVRAIGQLDELQRKLQFEALALSFAGTALITFCYGFFEGVGFPKLSMFTVWPIMATLWLIGVVLGRVRNG
jgi:CDP-diglyceride synthetase